MKVDGNFQLVSVANHHLCSRWWLSVCLALIGIVPAAKAGFTLPWSLGMKNGSPEEFGNEVFGGNVPPGSATVRDDDYYFAGTYPAPVNSVGTSEPIANLQRAVSAGHMTNRIHFNLSAAEATSTLRVRLVTRALWGGWWNAALGQVGTGFGTHDLRFRLNGGVIGTRTVTGDTEFFIEANAGAGGAFTPVNGENILEITRTGGTQDGWIAFDYFTFEIHPTALVDGDGDGLPRWWEEEQGLNDALAADAAQDSDGDGLSNTAERSRGTRVHDTDTDDDGLFDGVETNTGVYVNAANTGTNPLNADHDGDSLPDGAEVAGTPASNPLLTDTDGDGAADAWETHTGYLANNNTSTPPTWSGAIGVQFVSDGDPAGALTSLEVTGLVPQQNWNRTRPLTSWNTPSGTTADIAAPLAGTLVNSAGAGSGMTLSWNSQNTWFTGNKGGATQKLFSGYLNLYDAANAQITLSGIPYANYDVLVYVGNSYENSPGRVRLNDNAANDLYFSSASIAPQSTFIEPVTSHAARPWRGNVVRFRNVTGSSANVKLFRVNADTNTGIHAIQIVNATQDTDGDTLPDWWEFTHRLKPDLAADAAQDGDSDMLTNTQEFTRQTRPDLADTDGDGLTDAVETDTGTYVSNSNTGTNPLLTDTDGDSLSDAEEIAVKPAPTNPNLADTDGDGRSDAEEITRRTDPNSITTTTEHMPVVSATPHTLNWTLDVQIVWDHERGNMSGGQWGDAYLFQIAINNAATATWQNAMRVGLRAVQERLCHFLYTGHAGGFSSSNDPTGDNWNSDWNVPPADIKTALGFSGHGPCDISDRLRFEINANSSGAANAWSVTFRILNLDTTPSPTIVRTFTFNNCTAAATVHDGTVQWRDNDEPPDANRLIITTLDGVALYFQTTPLENTTSFSAWKDTDEDGMPDGWEDANLFNKNSAADAVLDTDSDGLDNLRECLAGTNPRQRDSDGDTIADGLEVSRGSDPLLATSRPGFYNGAPSGTSGADLNGNGLPDAWELWAGSFALSSMGDADSDGQNNAQEAIAGTDPFDPASRLWSVSTRSGNHLLLAWPPLPNKLHQAWESTNLTSWSLSGGSPAMVGNEYRQTFTNALDGAVPRKFYQVRVSDLDADLDGVSDWAEVNVLGSSATNANSLRSFMPVDVNGDGITESTIHGDYAAYIERFQGAGAAGGFPNGGTGSGGTTGSGISRAQAARFLTQATFGPVPEEMDRVQQIGYSAWLDEQIAKPATLHSTYARAISADYFGARVDDSYNGSDTDNFLFGNNLMTAFARAAIQGEDQLRQRVAFALSQICVASRRDANIENRVLGMADFYDIFVRNAFGSYHDVLSQVTLHPCMGRYLSHIGNQKANPAINQYPDENYAREVMQLFSIGLWELNMDGTRKVNGGGQNIPTYSNAEITQLARVMTGLWYSGHEWGGGGWSEGDYATPMGMNADRHDFGEKILLGGYIIPARAPTAANGLLDIADAIRHLFEHANCAPFVSRQLIQFLVTDNPSPSYVQRVASVFANDGSGTRGNLGAVVRAILLDVEARDPRHADGEMSYGRLKEPVIRTMALARAFGLREVPNLLWWDWGDYFASSRQEPGYSPSVFNFFRPDYRAPGAITQNQLSSPVFQITDSFSSIAFPNRLWSDIEEGFNLWDRYHFPLDLSRETALAATPELLVDHLNLIFCAGKMSAATRGILLSTLNQLPASQPEARARVAAYLVIVSPEGSVMR